jgi:hypothetical protein
MCVYYVLNTKDLRALLSHILIGEPTEERPTKDKERCVGSIENQSLLLVFFCLWAKRLVF